MNRRIVFLFLLLGLTLTTWAQQFPGGSQLPGGFPGFGGQQGRPSSTTGISGSGIDDSTKVIYGPKSTRYVLEEDIFNNRRKLYTVDTTMDDTHLFLYVQRSQNQYQDLGNLGTPMRPVFVQEPQQLGAQTGYYVFAPYAYQTMGVKYFDTKSPFTDMYLALGGHNQNILRFNFAQNITPRWNVGFNVQRFTSQKQFGTSGVNDPTKLLAQNWGFVGHTNYRSKNEKYTLLAHFINMNHSIDEQGGVLTGENLDGTPNIYAYTGEARLNGGSTRGPNPNGRELRNDWHVYHQYVLDQGFQVFHRLDYRRQKNYYQDDTLRLNQQTRSAIEGVREEIPGFYPAILGDTSRIEQDARFRLVENMFGLKGVYRRRGSAFNYRAYLRSRIYGQYTRYNTSRTLYNEYETRRAETFLGGWLGYYFPDSLSQMTAEAEYQVGGGFRLQGQFDSKWLTAGYSAMLVQPTLLQERFQSHIFFWRNDFKLRGYNHAFGQFNLRYRKLQLKPGLDYFLLSNYTYFDTAAIARQASGSFSVLRTGLGYQIGFGKFLTSGQLYYTVQSRTDILRTPPFFMNARLQYEFLYAKVLYIQVGVDLHYKSSYFADAYMPVTQQFYLQNKQRVEGYVLADLYANLRVNRTRLFVKLTHANQGVLQPGYFVAPEFLQMRRGFAFGVDWYLFD
ncbi:putative porin [Spirosoma taeanense]|uniref:Putative porin n=1 Tax=Spirosoma taeanense TaxID=2735870 RepID=A0A6M5Y8A6_9BACT|nr:putative porin [Spirosoma taeanense]QJW89413.1 putative porin [Spirosoma taeanense]